MAEDEAQEGNAAGQVAAGMVRCAACGTDNPQAMRFCGNCGQPLTPPPVPLPEAERGSSETSELPPLPERPSLETPPPLLGLPLSTSGRGTGGGVTPTALPAPTTSVAPAIPADPIARERERDRLLTLANVQRMRGQANDARQTLQNALLLVDGRAAAPIYELMGDLLATDEKWADAQEAYNEAHIADPARASAERKYATMTLRIADTKAERSIADAMMRGESIADLMVSTTAQNGGRGKRNAGMAMFLSVIVPGFGQFYNGDVMKGVILVGIFLADLLLLALTPDKNIFTRKIAAIFALSAGKYANQPVSALAIFAGLVLVAVWLYSIVDAPFMAAKTANTDSAEGGKPVVDKTGWEV